MAKQERIDFGEAKYPETASLIAVGDEVQGEVLEVGEVPIADRLASYLHISTEKGVRTLWLGKVLVEEVVKRNVKVGDYIGVKYLGEKESGKQSPYRDYDIRIIPAKEEEG